MNRLVFDIECIGVDFESLDEKAQHDLLRNAETDEEREVEKERLALWPVTGEVVAIGMLNVDTGNAKVFYRDAGIENEEYTKDGVSYKSTGSEKELLEWFWKDTQYFDQVISFNGRGFDGPYLHFRSMVHNVKPSKDLVPYRYDHKQHCDLLDQLSHYGSARRFSLHLYTQALGITSPKEDGVDGLAVPRLFAEGEYKTIAEYCMRDVYATAELYKRWEKFMKA